MKNNTNSIYKGLPKDTNEYKGYSIKLIDEYLIRHKKALSRITQNSTDFDSRILDVLLCPYNKFLPRVKHAGKIRGNRQIMHNGLKVYIDSYYPKLIVPMLMANRGVHEPEEEAYFSKVLELITNKKPVIIELGAYWAFYSMWFLKQFEEGAAYLVEPDKERLNAGKKNFKLNNFSGDWTESKISANSLNIDEFVKEKKIDYIDILHSDIQGAELEMLKGARNTFLNRRIGFTFISTHSNDLHMECLDILHQYEYHVIYSSDMNTSKCYDGIIIASKNPTSIKWI